MMGSGSKYLLIIIDRGGSATAGTDSMGPREGIHPSMVMNDKSYAILANATMLGCEIDEDNVIGGYRTELDSNANMPVLR